ncbi:MAG: TadE/TadG family type IV pilus assembly protein [Blastocatellia bacterium]
MMESFSYNHSRKRTEKRAAAEAAGGLRARRRQAGQSMVEMAFILPLFLAFVFSIFEIGRAWAAKQALTIAAREGARVLILPYGSGVSYATEGAVKAAAINTATEYMKSAGVSPVASTTITPVRIRPGSDGTYGTADDILDESYSDGVRGERVGIQINYDFDSPLAAILGMFGDQNQASTIKMGVRCFMDHE